MPGSNLVALGAWSYEPATDPIATTRLSLIVAGLVAPVLAAVFAIGLDPRDKRDLLPLALKQNRLAL